MSTANFDTENLSIKPVSIPNFIDSAQPPHSQEKNISNIVKDSAHTRKRHKTVRSAFVFSADNLSQRVVTGAGFTFLGITLRTVITFGSMAILARLLTPADFGYIAMATVVTELAALFGGFGLSNLLIQRKRINRLHLDTVFWASALLGLALAAGVFLMSFLSEWLFRDPLTGELLRVMSLTFVFGGLTCPHEAIISRLLRFHTEFWIQLTVIAVRSLTAIGFAYFDFGVWSLVAGSLAAGIVAVMLYILAVPYLPRFRFHLGYLTSTWKVSSSYFGSGFLYYIHMNVDLMLIGRTLGATSLGYYQNARSLTDEIRGRIAMPLQRVLFPTFSALQTDNARLQSTVIKAGRLLAAIIFPIGIGLSAVAQDMVPVLYGEQWLAMIPVLSMLGVSAAIRGSTAIASPLFNAKNRVALALKYNTVGTLLMVVAVVLALPFGVQVVATAVALASFYSLVTFRVGLGLIGLELQHAFQILRFPAIASSVMWASIAGLRPFSTVWVSHPAALLAIHVFIGALAYAVVLHLLSRQYLHDLTELTGKLTGRA